jgi:hypothetical protein
MKITNRNQGIPQMTEKEVQTSEYQGPKSLPEKPRPESKVDKYEGPEVFANRIIFPFTEPNIPAFATDRERALQSLSGLTGLGDRPEESVRSRPTSPVGRYKGPDSIIRQELESKVDQYKGPGSIQRPQIEAEVDKYKGPKSLPGEPEIESRVDKYKGPDSTLKQVVDMSIPPIPDIPGPDALDLVGGWFPNGSSNETVETVNYKASEAGLEVNKYKGPDSLVDSEKK